MNAYKGVSILIIAVMISALTVVYTKHQSRKLFISLQSHISERDQLDVEWGRLMLEQSTWVTPGRIEEIARKRLGMRLPEAKKIIIVMP